MSDSNVGKTVSRVAGFLFLRGAVNQRNLTSIGLVIFFMFVYVLAGGKIERVPRNIRPGGTFGAVEVEGNQKADIGEPPVTTTKKVTPVQVKEGRSAGARGASDAKPKSDGEKSQENTFSSFQERLEKIRQQRR